MLHEYISQKLTQVEGYQEAEPFPHVVMDDFLPEDIAEQALIEIPSEKSPVWREYRHKNSLKKACSNWALFGKTIVSIHKALQHPNVVQELKGMTRITPLFADSGLYGGGMHRIDLGGYLNMHVDFNWHKKMNKKRAINLLLFLNKDWLEDEGGELYLGKNKEVKVLPEFNRCVIFSTSEESWHGHPEPALRKRLSLAAYYYTDGNVDQQHGTIYTDAR